MLNNTVNDIKSTQNLKPVYFVFGAEMLLVEQSLLKIRKLAIVKGHAHRVSFEIDGQFNWDEIHREMLSANLFFPKRVIECRLKSNKLSAKAAQELIKIISSIPKSIVFIISAGKLTPSEQASKWVQALKKHGEVIMHWEIRSNQLVQWILNNMVRLNLEANQEVAENIAFCTEGNLFASMQEIEKLKIAYPNGKIDVGTYKAQLEQQSKYSIYGLINAALLGNSNQVIKIYDILIHDKSTPIILSGVLYVEIKKIVGMAIELQQSKQIASVLQNNNVVWASKKYVISNVLRRHSYKYLQKILLSLGHIDRSIKGIGELNVTDELRLLLLNLCRS